VLTFLEHAVLSQIKADLWRKNGIGMRGQMHHYRDVGIREATIDQEFWTLQFGLCVMDPVQFFVTLIDRFDLTTLFRGDVLEPEIWEDDQAEPRQRVMLLEDFMLLTLNLATDTATAMDWSQERSTRFHIIQQLAINTFTYSELTKRLPERVLDHSFLHILAEVADFREPTETVVGAYSLKPEYLDEVNPYWRHYTRNDMRSVADKILARKKKLEPATDPFITPRLELPGHNSPFHGIRGWLHSSVIAQIIHYALAHCIPIADPSEWPGLQFMRNDDGMPQFDLLLDLTLHLAMVALQAAPETFAESSIEIIEQANSMSTFQNLWFMQTNEAFKPFHPKVNFILEQIVANLPPDYTQDYRAQRAEELVKLEQKAKAEQTKPDPREAAAARQKKIMAEFAKKQADFVAAFDEESDEEEDIAEEAVECYGQCIVCQDDVTVKNTGGLLALIQPNRVIREVVNDRDWFEESLLAPSCLDGATRYHRYGLGSSGEPTSTDGYPSSNNRFGVYVSACSHLMHESCINRYFDATRSRHTQQVQRHHPENAVRCEYLCPLCKSLGNVLIPLDPTQANLKPYIPTSTRGPPGRPPSLSEKIRDVSSEGLLKVRDSAKIWEHHVETGELTPWFSDTNFSAASLDPAYRRQIRLTARMIERFRFLVRPLSEQSQRIRGKKTHMYVPDDIVSYTVSACEIAQRGLQTPGQTVAEQVPEISMTLIKKLIGMLQLELDIFFGPSYDRTALRVGMFARFLPDWYRASTLPSPLLLRQPLVLVVEAAAIAPDLLQAVIVMAYYAELTRTMLGLSMWVRRCLGNRQQPQPRTSPPADSHLADALSVFSGFRPIMQSILRNNAGPFTDSESVLALLSDEMLAKLLYSHTLPFLRRATIIFHATAGAYPVSDPSIIVTEGCEYRRLLSLLGIVPPLETLSNPHSTESPIIARWLTQWAMQGRIVPQLEYPGTYELARLSLRWEDLMIRYQDHRCDKCGTKPSYPALCLYCGNFVCLGGDCCSEGELGECNIHMRE
jgi:E3 ubiquitin-protein ligase UBR1